MRCVPSASHCVMVYWCISRFKNLPRFPWVHHFSNGVSELQSITAAEQSAILCVRHIFIELTTSNFFFQYIAPLLLGLCDEEHNQDNLLIPAIWCLACIDTLSGFHVHTSDTLFLLEDQVQQFGILTQVSQMWVELWNHGLIDIHQAIRESEAYKDDKKLSFKWPKMHSLSHLVDSIKRRGVTSSSGTEQGEALHPQNKKWWGRSNRQASAPIQVGCFVEHVS